MGSHPWLHFKVIAIVHDREDQTGSHPWLHSSRSLRSSMIAKIKRAAIHGCTLQGIAIAPGREDQTDVHPWLHAAAFAAGPGARIAWVPPLPPIPDQGDAS
ncbi:hypothetical protein [Rhodanobacter sp. DHB23]|uniref:hypothetical protein n=1 Tax=Rhodanobacter sp. DHB23 TaxID=2775923 RepID=UPI0017804944|nr:hypothetical protein [Rhodanobacter sp. DHB23]MBD8873568.1 hypothetical protein [Rhodanobacter sp. DHB23]